MLLNCTFLAVFMSFCIHGFILTLHATVIAACLQIAYLHWIHTVNVYREDTTFICSTITVCFKVPPFSPWSGLLSCYLTFEEVQHKFSTCRDVLRLQTMQHFIMQTENCAVYLHRLCLTAVWPSPVLWHTLLQVTFKFALSYNECATLMCL